MKHIFCGADLETQAEFQTQVTLMFVQDTKAKLNFNEHFQPDSATAVSIQESISSAYKTRVLNTSLYCLNTSLIVQEFFGKKNPTKHELFISSTSFLKRSISGILL